MITNRYESHVHNDPVIPVLFHFDVRKKEDPPFPHWHESIELLLVMEGEIISMADANRIVARAGEMVIINSGHMHSTQCVGDIAKYYCMIIDKSVCEEIGIYVEEILFEPMSADSELIDCYHRVKEELQQQKELYRFAAKAAVIDLMVTLYRKHILRKGYMNHKPPNTKKELIKNAIGYMHKNYHENTSTSLIAKKIGLSPAYFCRTFKEITGYTPVSYMNYLKCYQAKRLFVTEKCTVSEAAHLCGYDNLSYFSKIYKKYMGNLPSEDMMHS